MTSVPAFSGLITALVTPFSGQALDEAALHRLIDLQASGETDGLLVGSQAAGEAATLTPNEAVRLIERSVAAAGSRLKIIADASANSTATAISLVQQAERAGAHGALLMAPWYNRPSQAGVIQHFEEVTRASQLPLLIGNCPERSRVDMAVEMLARVARMPNVAALVEFSADVARISAMRRICLPHIKVFSGLDATLLGAMAHGADGVVSLTANVAPHLVRSVYDAALANDWERARRAHERLLGLHRLVAEDPVPSALKFALARGGRCAADVRLPITPCLPETAMRARTILEDLGLAVADDRHQRSSDARDLTHATEAG